MSRRTATIEAEYFDRLYRAEGDPWRFGTSEYERNKYTDTLDLLSRARYGDALEIGCSIGVFTRRLAGRCDRLVAVDTSEVALASARAALIGVDNVDLRLAAAPAGLPDGPFDLIVLSEVLYYFVEADARATLQTCFDLLAKGGEILLCHWLGETDYPLSGDAAAELALREATARGLAIETRRRSAYRLDRLLNGGSSHPRS